MITITETDKISFGTPFKIVLAHTSICALDNFILVYYDL